MKRFLAFLMLAVAMIGGPSGFAIAQGSEDERERLEDAKRRLEEAAGEIAEISGKWAMDSVHEIVRKIRVAEQGAVLGVYIGCLDNGDVRRGCPEEGDPEGVKISGVTPGGPADDAGLKAGDVIVAVNDYSVVKDTPQESFDELRRRMDEVEPGDKIAVRYVREGNEITADVVAGEVNPYAFAFSFDDHDFDFDFDADLENLPARAGHWHMRLGRWRDIELVALTPKLGEYFGTDEGLLVVRAPEDDDLQLEDGDVITSIDGRTPKSPGHAMRILRSYQSGEQLNIDIVRKKKKRTLNIELPGGKSEASLRAPRAPRVESRTAIET